MSDSNNTPIPTKNSRKTDPHGYSALGNWRAMKSRCFTESDDKYARYGGAGITACRGLRDSYAYFLSIVGDKPGPTHQLDRENNLGSYTCGKCAECIEKNWPLNIRWLTPKQNARNRRNNLVITYNGETRTLPEWCEVLGIDFPRIRQRLYAGWKPSEAFTVPEYGHRPGFKSRKQGELAALIANGEDPHQQKKANLSLQE